MGFTSAFGIDWRILTFQLLNFALIYFAFAKFVWPIILKALDKRQREIATGLDNAEKAKINLSNAEKQKQEITNQAKLKAKNLISETQKQNKLVRESFLQQLTAEREALLQSSADQAAREKSKILNQAQQELGSALAQSLEEFFSEDLTHAQKEKLNDRFVQILENK